MGGPYPACPSARGGARPCFKTSMGAPPCGVQVFCQQNVPVSPRDKMRATGILTWGSPGPAPGKVDVDENGKIRAVEPIETADRRP